MILYTIQDVFLEKHFTFGEAFQADLEFSKLI